MADLPVADWGQVLERMRAQWQPLAPPGPFRYEDWGDAIDRMKGQQADLERHDHWRAGRADLLHVAGVAGSELVHSAVLAWLLKPSAKHGFGTAFLVDLVRQTWPGLELEGAEAAAVSREVERRDNGRWRRTDVIVKADQFTLVIENKVYSDESKGQCEDLYRLWARGTKGEGAGDHAVRFVLLSRHGRMPWSVGDDDEARLAWRALSYRWIEGWLSEHIERISSPVARSTAIQYLIALRSVAGSPDE